MVNILKFENDYKNIFGDISENKKIAIIGNSRNILRYKYGNIIDNYDKIVRCNWASTKNIEEYVGCKESIRICALRILNCEKHVDHPKGMILDYNLYKTFENINIMVFHINNTNINKNINDVLKKYDKQNNYYTINFEKKYFNNILKKFDIAIKTNKSFQTGLSIILHLVNLGYKPDIFGFDLKMCNENYGYPWSIIKHKTLSPDHEISKEHQILIELDKKNLIRIINEDNVDKILLSSSNKTSI